MAEKQYSGVSVKSRLSAGFTLIEITIVVILMGIIATFSLPAITDTLEANRLRGAADEVVMALEYAQLTAMTSGRGTRVVITPGTEQIDLRQYTITADLFGGGDELNAADVESGTYDLMQYPLKKGLFYPITLGGENRFKGVDITQSDFDTGNHVDFNAQGAPSKGGTVTIVSGGDQIIVTLDTLTGKVSVSE